ncbi:MAG: hypothetical protein VR72_03045 [Clostridiaceae bacterium BRH_c20a]|nr:MAG: hypothetical protein VR72_03045 [Clostridiaceae bacterium BRH_c20a]
MKKYIGFKIIEAEPMSVAEYNDKVRPLVYSGDCQEGYKVVYPDGYVSWSPKEVFEKAYMQIGDNNTVTQEMVDNFITAFDVDTIGQKTTIVGARLVNGFEIYEFSSCVDPANYDEALGAEICKKRIKDKVWYLLGFLLQTAKEGIKS